MSQRRRELNLEHLHTAMRSETEISWQRNNYFLVVASILLLALSQLRGLTRVQELIILVGIAVSVTWILAHYRSDEYLGYWKGETRRLENALGHSTVYPEGMAGMEMRRVLYAVPIAFLFLWVVLLIMVMTGWLHI